MSKWSGPSAAKQRASYAERGRAPKASEPPAQVLCTSIALPNQLTPNSQAEKLACDAGSSMHPYPITKMSSHTCVLTQLPCLRVAGFSVGLQLSGLGCCFGLKLGFLTCKVNGTVLFRKLLQWGKDSAERAVLQQLGCRSDRCAVQETLNPKP